MQKLVWTNEEIPNYQGHFNIAPDIITIPEKIFWRRLFMYSWDYVDYKQVTDGAYRHDLKLWIVQGFGLTVGIAVSDPGDVTFYGFGDWETFSRRFNDQFRGDNS